MLMGFADLVFEFEGKYWVLDYKSNHLGEDDAAYSRDKLAQSMAQHRYDVQAAIYMLALHRLLRLRLGTAYDPKTHLGGAVYLFLRGIKGPERGVCLIPASPPLMDALDAMLDDGEGDAWTL
jgi:exodeoxyribonuclease V beta subunit